MPTLSVCIELFWTDRDPVERIGLAAQAGYHAVEFWGYGNKDLPAITAAAREHDLAIAACCLQAGGALVDPQATDALVNGLRDSCAVAEQLGTRRLIVTAGQERAGESFATTRATVVRNLQALTALLDEHDIELVVEPLNTIVDHPGHWLSTMGDAADILQEVDHPRIKILMDIYHQQVTEGNIIHLIREHAPLIGHYHCAGVPGRNELVGGELDYRAIFAAIDETGYEGYVGLEFRASGDPVPALAQARSLTAP